jgi:hypothetical protein
MSVGDKILLAANGTFTILGLVFMLYLPQNTLFALPGLSKVVFYAASAVCFFIFLKKRDQLKTALALTWINCVVFLVCTTLFVLANWYA